MYGCLKVPLEALDLYSGRAKSELCWKTTSSARRLVCSVSVCEELRGRSCGMWCVVASRVAINCAQSAAELTRQMLQDFRDGDDVEDLRIQPDCDNRAMSEWKGNWVVSRIMKWTVSRSSKRQAS